MKIYTRTGDKGQTRIIGNKVVQKDDARVEAYGTIDELNSIVGMIIATEGMSEEIKDELKEIQQYLFDCGTDIASPYDQSKHRTKEEFIQWLENRIDIYTNIPPKIESFILPGGSPAAGLIHFARTVARRAERRVVTFQNLTESNKLVLTFLNRLSDYFFVLARLVNFQSGNLDSFYERSGKVFR